MPRLRQARRRSLAPANDGVDAARAHVRGGIAKAHFVGQDVPRTNAVHPSEKSSQDRVFEKIGVLEPPYSPEVCCQLFEHSNSLRQNVDAYAVNIDGHGYRFEPVVDLEADDAFERVRDAMFLEALIDADETGVEDSPEFAADEAVEARIEEMRTAMRLEKAKLEAFFEYACQDMSFITLRKRTRADLEIQGNGYWEVLRNRRGQPARFTWVPAFTMRLLPLDPDLVEVTTAVKRAPFTYEEVTERRRFRRYVQSSEGSRVFFKELGDPRVVSSATGKVYATEEELVREETRDGVRPTPATELLHFAVHSPKSPYGVPRWVGVLLAVLGSRQSEEVNFLYFENKSVPPLAILVSGGRLTQESVRKIETMIENRIKGRSNFHKALVIEAEPAGTAAIDAANGAMKIEIVPLTGSQHGDALFQKYDERNIDKVGMAFRLPRMLRGDIRDFNRSTSEAALEFAEAQVFGPEREDFDWIMDRRILSELRVRFWEFRSNAPTSRNPLDTTDIIVKLITAGVLTPAEAREFAEAVFNRDLKKIDEVWTKLPPDIVRAAIQSKKGLDETIGGLLAEDASLLEPPDDDTEEREPDESKEPDDEAKRREKTRGFTRYPVSQKRYRAAKERDIRGLARDLVRLRDALDAEADTVGVARVEAEHAEHVGLEKEVVRISAEEFRELVETEAAE